MPRYPIYIVSKGRWDTRLTAKSLEASGVPYFIVVEAQEAEAYRHVCRGEVLVLDPAYQRDYDTCDALGDSKPKGAGAARNFAWDHAQASGAERHWVMDDNIKGFYRFNRNMKIPAHAATVVTAMEDFVDRYQNVAMAGPNYFMFASRKEPNIAPFTINTRIYSCNLIRNDLPYRWRGRYNEDTDLSLRMLKDGWATIQFNALLQYKMPTQHMRGGNTDAFYSVEGTLAKSRMQVDLHPDVSRLVWKFNRWHHHVDYSRFKTTPLIRRPDAEIPSGVNDYGMRLVHLQDRAQSPIPAMRGG